MRTLTSTLLAAQVNPRLPLFKAVISQGGTSYTYYGSAAANSRVINATAAHQEDNYTLDIVLNNSDKVVSALSLKGYKVVPSWGFTTSAGDEYSADPSLYVIGQEQPSAPGLLICTLKCAGIINMINEDEASAKYTLASDDTQTVKTLFQKIAGDTGVSLLAPFSHCVAYDCVFDSEDSLIDVYIPADSFAIRLGQSRLNCLKELLSYTKCKMRIENDDKIHIFVPRVTTSTAWVANTLYAVGDRVIPTTANEVEYTCTTAGTSHATTEPTWPTEVGQTVADGAGALVWTVSYHYDYRLESTYHKFFNETYRERLVVPNYFVVSSRDQDTPAYTGYATDGTTGDNQKRTYSQYKVASNAQCTAIAAAKLANLQMAAERGSGLVPMNVGAELYDFVKVKDTRLGEYMVGNLLYFRKTYQAAIGRPAAFEMEFRFGLLLGVGLAGTTVSGSGGGGGSTQDLTAMWNAINTLIAQMAEVMAKLQQIFDWINAQTSIRCKYLYDANGNLMGVLCANATEAYLVATAAGSDLLLYNSSVTGGTSIAAGKVPSSPDNGVLLLDGAVAVKIPASGTFILPTL